jgi:predicted extracellular nuclease
MKLNRIFVAILLLLAVFLLPVGYLNSGVSAASSSVVISEFRTRGPNGGNDEFIELYNLSSSMVDLSGWKIHGSNAAAATSVRSIIPNGTSLAAHCHYLIGNSNSNAGPYSGSATPDQTYSVGITDDGGIALTRADDSIVDQVGLSAGSAFLEGSPLSPNTQNTNHSYERKPGGSVDVHLNRLSLHKKG